jgi:transcription-repair coupling factor (superfamily II helicase)
MPDPTETRPSSADAARPGAPVDAAAQLRRIVRVLDDDAGMVQVLGSRSATLVVPEAARAISIARLAHGAGRRPLMVGVPTSAEADRLAADLSTWLGSDEVESFPAWETLPFERMSPGVDTMGRRVRTLWRLAHDPPSVVVAPVRALIQRLGPGAGQAGPVHLKVGDEVDPVELVTRLVHMGYRREYQVEHRGEVSVRGSIVDVFPATADLPVRIDLWGDEVDRLTEFSVGDQRSTVDVPLVEVYACRELQVGQDVRDRATALVASEPWGREQWERLAEGQVFDGMESWLPWLTDDESLLPDLLGDDALVLLVEPRRMRDRAADLLAEEADLAATLARTWDADLAGGGANHLYLPFDRLLTGTTAPVWHLPVAASSPDEPAVAATGWASTQGDHTAVHRQLSQLLTDGYRVVVTADGAGSAVRIVDVLVAAGIDATFDRQGITPLTDPGVHVVVAPLERGAVLTEARLAVLTEAELTGRRRAHRQVRPRRRRSGAVAVFDDLQPGDHVVHHQHGVARYAGMVTRAIGGVERDYLLLEYRGDDKLYVPTDQVDLVRPYTGGESPSLSRLGGGEWQRTRAKVRAEVAQIAQELVVLYQKRVHAPGHPFAADTTWQHEFEESFPFEETPDQLTAIADVKADMEAAHPMDRLVCGDVGFGKTEVALRAVFKAVQDGKQAAVLVPTTLLAQQHHQTFGERLAPYPIRVEVLSRFLTAGQARAVLEGLASGEVDVVVGTHRLLGEEVRFRDLGLLVVDEEQRFGVSHKERIKQMRHDVDVLTLTATPIPRTLEMGLTGIRDLTLLQTPPADRQPILTYVGEYDDRAVAEAIRRELLREGQVFFVHNRIADIDKVANHVRSLVPEARVAVAHGQMDEGSLEQVVVDFWEGNHDVLVCTTIIESGIDMPTVNTLVVDRADLLGLGQLHQLRGRVGRAGQRAYAYLFHPVDRVLTEEAYERLKTIGESTELGSGFRIAMRDLEIRGAGNLLGTGQSGHIAAVGYDLYCEMVSEAVAELRGEVPEEAAEVTIEVPLAASLPADYVAREDLRLEAYRRLATVTTAAEVDDVAAEWLDRYGPVPPAAAALLGIARLRAAAHRTGLREVAISRSTAISGPRWMARLEPVQLRLSKATRLERLHPKATWRKETGQLLVPVPGPESAVDDLLALIDDLLDDVPEAPAADVGGQSADGQAADGRVAGDPAAPTVGSAPL